jgi:hypothetical protein
MKLAAQSSKQAGVANPTLDPESMLLVDLRP